MLDTPENGDPDTGMLREDRNDEGVRQKESDHNTKPGGRAYVL